MFSWERGSFNYHIFSTSCVFERLATTDPTPILVRLIVFGNSWEDLIGLAITCIEAEHNFGRETFHFRNFLTSATRISTRQSLRTWFYPCWVWVQLHLIPFFFDGWSVAFHLFLDIGQSLFHVQMGRSVFLAHVTTRNQPSSSFLG